MSASGASGAWPDPWTIETRVQNRTGYRTATLYLDSNRVLFLCKKRYRREKRGKCRKTDQRERLVGTDSTCRLAVLFCHKKDPIFLAFQQSDSPRRLCRFFQLYTCIDLPSCPMIMGRAKSSNR